MSPDAAGAAPATAPQTPTREEVDLCIRPENIDLMSPEAGAASKERNRIAGQVLEVTLLGAMRQFGHLITFSETPGSITRPPPLVGQHSREILREAGYRDADVDTLIAGRVVYEPDDAYRERFRN